MALKTNYKDGDTFAPKDINATNSAINNLSKWYVADKTLFIPSYSATVNEGTLTLTFNDGGVVNGNN